MGIRPPGTPRSSVAPSRPTRNSTRRDDRGRPSPTQLITPLALPPEKKGKEKKKKKDMIVTTLRRSLLRNPAPRRRLAASPFTTSTTLSSTSSSSSASTSASAAQKKAQDALGGLSATLVRAGAYARSALGPFGTRLSGLLGCPSLLPSPSFLLSFPIY